MSLQPDRRYDGIILDAGLTQSENKGTPALWFSIKTEDGNIDNYLWLTPNTTKRAAETMEKCFGTTRAELADMQWFETLSERLRGAEVSITTVLEESEDKNGETHSGIKVQWMNPRGIPKKAPTPATKSRVVQLFGGASPGPMPGRSAGGNAKEPAPWGPDPEDVPF